MRYQFVDKEHAHFLDGKRLTGTSSVTGVLAKPLTWWASGKAVEKLGWMNPKYNDDKKRLEHVQPYFDKVQQFGQMPNGEMEYLKLLDTAYRSHFDDNKETKKAGTDLHAELEMFVKASIEVDGIATYMGSPSDSLISFAKWSVANVKRFIASEAHSYNEELWVGGIMDAVAELKDGGIAVIDFKSAKDAYVDHFIQVGGYATQVEKNGLFTKDGKQVHEPMLVDELIVIPFGAKEFKVERRNNTTDYKEGFRHAVALYRLMGLEENGN